MHPPVELELNDGSRNESSVALEEDLQSVDLRSPSSADDDLKRLSASDLSIGSFFSQVKRTFLNLGELVNIEAPLHYVCKLLCARFLLSGRRNALLKNGPVSHKVLALKGLSAAVTLADVDVLQLYLCRGQWSLPTARAGAYTCTGCSPYLTEF